MEDMMKVVRETVTLKDGRRYVEIDFASGPEDDPTEFIRLRTDIDPEGYPRLVESVREGLLRARDAISERLQATADTSGRR